MKTCLIIEDSPVIREIAVRILRELNLEATEAPNAHDGVELCRAEKPDAVFLDWDLPSMGALDFLRGVGELEAAQRPTIILCATENDPQQFTLAKAAGAAHHILKPFDRQSIEEKLVELGLVEASGAAAPVKAVS
jgi:two-component system chemotaxis response regulator CheY